MVMDFRGWPNPWWLSNQAIVLVQL